MAAMAGFTKARGNPLDTAEFRRDFENIVGNVEKVIKGKSEVVRLSLVAILCEGHILFEDVPGTGKSMLARALSQSIKASNNRIQCTPDMLPGDITGSSIYDQNRGVFDFRPGPVFANVLLADEVNRATPKTQSALLEAMAERRVSIDGVTHDLPRPFLVLATQNPIELAGTFPLPEAQLDRFLFKLTMGYLDRDREFEVMFDNSINLSIEQLGAVVDPETVNRMIEFASVVEVSPEVGYYIVDLVQASRSDPAAAMGGSPRAAIALLRASRVLAASQGRQQVEAEDVRTVLGPVMRHRVILNPDAILRGETMDAILERITGRIKPPAPAPRRELQLAAEPA
jgi:MoxR-like ATPase